MFTFEVDLTTTQTTLRNLLTTAGYSLSSADYQRLNQVVMADFISRGGDWAFRYPNETNTARVFPVQRDIKQTFFQSYNLLDCFFVSAVGTIKLDIFIQNIAE